MRRSLPGESNLAWRDGHLSGGAEPRLEAQRQAIEAAIPPDRAAELRTVEIRLANLRRARHDLEAGRGRYANTAEGEAALTLNTARSCRQEAERLAETADSRRQRRQWRQRAKEWADREARTQHPYNEIVPPEAARVERQITDITSRLEEVRQYQDDRVAWLRGHPDATFQLKAIERELDPFKDMPETHQELRRLLAPGHEPELRRGVDREPDIGLDIGP